MTPVGTLVQLCRTAIFALGRELAAWKGSTARATFAAQAMLSVALSVALANALGLSDTWWAAISGFAVMQPSFAGSVQRAAHRIIGTVIGAADLPEANLRTLTDRRDVLYPDGGSGLRLKDGCLNIVDVGEEANFLDVDLLIALLDEASAGVDVVGGDLLLNLLDGEAVAD